MRINLLHHLYFPQDNTILSDISVLSTTRIRDLKVQDVSFSQRWLLGFHAMQFVESQPTFQINFSTPSSRLKSKTNKKLARRKKLEKCSRVSLKNDQHYVDSKKVSLTAFFMLISCSTFKMQATCSSEESADFQHTTRRCIPEDKNLP
jgi:hypothetical protein